MYYVIKPLTGTFLLFGHYSSYEEASKFRKLMQRPGEFIILKDAFKENEWGAPKCSVPTESEIHGD